MKRSFRSVYDYPSGSSLLVPAAPARMLVTKRWIPKKVGQGYRSVIPRMAGNASYRSGRSRVGGFYGRFNRPGLQTPEMKYFDDIIDGLTIDTTPEVPAGAAQWDFVALGTGPQNRIGRSILCKSLQLRGTLRFVPGATTRGTATVVMYVMLDTQANGANPAAADVFSQEAGGTFNMVTAMINLENAQRFKVLKKFRVTFNSQAGASAAYAQVTKNIDWYHKCNIPFDYDTTGTGGAIADMKSNHIFIVWGADADADDLVEANLYTRIRFIDC